MGSFYSQALKSKQFDKSSLGDCESHNLRFTSFSPLMPCMEASVVFLLSFLSLICLYHFAWTTTHIWTVILTVCCLFVVLAGMEVAAALTDKAHSVSVIGIESVPFKKALGEKVGKAIMKVGTHSWEIKLLRTWGSSRILSLLSTGREKILLVKMQMFFWSILQEPRERESVNLVITQQTLMFSHGHCVCGVFSLCSSLRPTGWSSTCWTRCQRWLAIMDRYSESERNSMTWCSAALCSLVSSTMKTSQIGKTRILPRVNAFWSVSTLKPLKMWF